MTSNDQEPDQGATPTARVSWWRAKGMGEVAIFTAFTVLLAVGVAVVKEREPSLLKTIVVAVGSEDMDFFQEPQVVADLANDGYSVVPVPMGSRQMVLNAAKLSAQGYDAFFPSSEDFAEEIQGEINAPYGNQEPFSTPLAVFTWQGVLPKLQGEGIVDAAGTDFNLGAYFTATKDGQNQTLLDMSNPMDSDSGAMLLGAAAVALNGGQSVTSVTQATELAGQIRTVVAPLGGTENTTSHVFNEYLDDGESAEPLALGYQSEFLETQRAGKLPSGAVMLRLDPTINCVHTIVPLDTDALKLATLLSTDSSLQALAAQKYGFVDSAGGGTQQDFADPPSIDVLNAMINAATAG